MLSTLVFPFVGSALRKGRAEEEGEDAGADPPDAGPSPLGERPAAQPSPAA
jgi:hypothetical protein